MTHSGDKPGPGPDTREWTREEIRSHLAENQAGEEARIERVVNRRLIAIISTVAAAVGGGGGLLIDRLLPDDSVFPEAAVHEKHVEKPSKWLFWKGD
jgi:hypothetical protein